MICARTSRATKKHPTNMLVIEIIEMSSIFKYCHLFRTVQSPSAHNTFTSMFLQHLSLSCVFFKCPDRLHFFFLGPTAYTCSHIDHMRKVFLHFGFACVIWVTEPVWRKCYIGHKNKAFCHCALACVFGDSKLEWKNICIGRMKRASRYGVFIAYVFWVSKPVWKNTRTDRMQKGFHHCGSSCVLRAWAVVEE